MAAATLKITLRDGTTECFSEPVVGKEGVDYEMMDKALHRLQEHSNVYLTVHVEKEKGMDLTSKNNCGDNDDTEESSEDDGNGIDNNDQDKPPEKKLKL